MLKLIRALGVAGLVVCADVAGAQTGTGQDVIADVGRLRRELDETRLELVRLRADVEALKNAVHPPTTAAPGIEPQPATPSTVAALEMVQAQLAEQAQTKVESASKLPLRIFGTIHSTMSWNTGEANWLENPNIVRAAPDGPQGSFNSTLRQSRIGLSTHGLALGAWQAAGSIVFDFLGGAPPFKTGQFMGLPRLLYAFARLERGTTAVQIGQDNMILAPRDPTSIAAPSFPLLFHSGNLYLRVPQVRVESRLAGTETSELRLAAGILAPVAGDFPQTGYVFAPPALAGERSRWPAVQARLGWQQGDVDRGASAGLSGHVGRERSAGTRDESWAAALDFNLQGRRLGVTGEGFVGENIDAFGGALGQQARSAGGFLEARLRPHDRWELVVGGGTDRVERADPLALTLSRNDSGFGSVIYRLSPEVATAIEYRRLVTTTLGRLRRENNHINWTFAYSF